MSPEEQSSSNPWQYLLHECIDAHFELDKVNSLNEVLDAFEETKKS